MFLDRSGLNSSTRNWIIHMTSRCSLSVHTMMFQNRSCASHSRKSESTDGFLQAVMVQYRQGEGRSGKSIMRRYGTAKGESGGNGLAKDGSRGVNAGGQQGRHGRTALGTEWIWECRQIEGKRGLWELGK